MPSCFWKSNLSDKSYRFLVIASGKQVPIEGFDRRSLDAKLSIAVTANFTQNHTAEEAEVRQIGGIAKHFHQVSKATPFDTWQLLHTLYESQSYFEMISHI